MGRNYTPTSFLNDPDIQKERPERWIRGLAIFKSLDDFWTPFTLGAGPAPGYCVNLEPEARATSKYIAESTAYSG